MEENADVGFTLQVDFAGLCFHLFHPDGRQVGVIMPDARLHAPDDRLTHPDGTDAKPHVGYVGFDLADAGFNVPRGPRSDPNLPTDSPQYEVVHLFDHEELDFGLDFNGAMSVPEFVVADTAKFAPELIPLPAMFGRNPPAALLMRTILRGGQFKAVADLEQWFFEKTFTPDRPDFYVGNFSGSSRWTRTVKAEHLTLKIKKFDGTVKTEIELRPGDDRRIRLKIANLCENNPLEWEELGIRLTSPEHPFDDDFKWYYHLLKHPTRDFGDLLKDTPSHALPHPRLDLMVNAGGKAGNCGHAMMTTDFLAGA
jgi:hypothetical protein